MFNNAMFKRFWTIFSLGALELTSSLHCCVSVYELILLCCGLLQSWILDGFCLRNFNEHVSLVCKKVNNQLNLMIRFPNLICTATKLKLYYAFILPHFQYCSMVWHFCSARNCEKLESLNTGKRALRIVFNRRIQNIIVNHYLQMFELYESSP